MQKLKIMNTTINLREVQILSAKLAGNEPPVFNGPYLFWYTVFTFVQNKTYTTLTEVQAGEKLKNYRAMEVFYCKFPDSKTPIPEILKNRRGLQTETCTSYEQVSELIYLKTEVKVPEASLRGPQKMWSKPDARQLGVRAVAFVKEANEADAKEKRVQEIMKCLLENNLKLRNKCLNNCKSK